MSVLSIEKGLSKVKNLAQGSKMQRFLRQPLSYLTAQVFRTMVFPISKKGILRQAHTFMGYPLSIALPSGMDIYLTGGKTHDSEIRLAQFLIQFYKKNTLITPIFIDIGAHIGYFSLLVAKILEEYEIEGKIYAFEAAKGTFELLQENLRAFKNIQCFHNALTDTEQDLSFYEFPVLYSEYNTLHIQQFENEKWFKKFRPTSVIVKGKTLDSIVDEYPIQNPLIKIDTEGAEEQVIKGGKAFLKSQNPTLIIEFLADKNKNEGHFKAYELLKEWGYQAHFIKDSGQLEVLDNIEMYFKNTGLDSDNFVFIKN